MQADTQGEVRKMKAEPGVMLTQTKECWEPQKLPESRKDPPERFRALLTPRLQTSGLWNSERTCVLSHPVCGTSSQQPQEMSTLS